MAGGGGGDETPGTMSHRVGTSDSLSTAVAAPSLILFRYRALPPPATIPQLLRLHSLLIKPDKTYKYLLRSEK